MDGIRAHSIEKAFDAICKLESRLNESEKDIAVLNKLESRLNESEKDIAILNKLEGEMGTFKELIDNRFSYMQKAVDKAEQTLNIRLTGMNEFRDQLKDQTKTFVTTDVFEARLKSIDTKTEGIQRIVYIGIGIFVVIQIAIQALMKFLP